MLIVTGGTLKGNKIKTLDGLKTRPTSSKVRESIFNIIQFRIKNSSWLDCFSGTGIVGIEALSRGANKVTFVEKNQKAYSIILENIKKLNLLDYSETYKTDFVNFIKMDDNKYDFIYFDPPYQSNYYEIISDIFKNKNFLNKDGNLIIEHESSMNIFSIFNNLQFIKTYKYGRTCLSFFKNLDT
jgi:16S rRNA (guanine(966)-N(2))-methyltransferase RsmD